MIHTILFDWQGILYNPATKALYPGAREVLTMSQTRQIPLVLMGKGGIDPQPEVEQLGLKDRFTAIILSPLQYDLAVFTPFVSVTHPQDTIFIEDWSNMPLVVGNRLRGTTIWVKHDGAAAITPVGSEEQPLYTLSSLPELKAFLDVIIGVEQSLAE
jgi:FMN phosphatase YigB (HAD superfamily)